MTHRQQGGKSVGTRQCSPPPPRFSRACRDSRLCQFARRGGQLCEDPDPDPRARIRSELRSVKFLHAQTDPGRSQASNGAGISALGASPLGCWLRLVSFSAGTSHQEGGFPGSFGARDAGGPRGYLVRFGMHVRCLIGPGVVSSSLLQQSLQNATTTQHRPEHC